MFMGVCCGARDLASPATLPSALCPPSDLVPLYVSFPSLDFELEFVLIWSGVHE
jgi:hypothetical protein